MNRSTVNSLRCQFSESNCSGKRKREGNSQIPSPSPFPIRFAEMMLSLYKLSESLSELTQRINDKMWQFSGLAPAAAGSHYMPGRKKLSDTDKTELIAAYLAGQTVTALAKVYGMSRGHCSRVVNGFKQQRIVEGKSELDPTQFRERIVSKSVRAVEAGLDAYIDDPIRAGALGFQNLKEMEVLRSVAEGHNITIDVYNMPANWRERFAFSEEDTRDIEAIEAAKLEAARNVTPGEDESQSSRRK